MKKFLLGVLVGGLIFGSIPLAAAIEEYICYKADYKVVINGQPYEHPELPILNYKGNTYAPFRSVLEAAGLNVNWNAELNQAEVNNMDNQTNNNDNQTIPVAGPEENTNQTVTNAVYRINEDIKIIQANPYLSDKEKERMIQTKEQVKQVIERTAEKIRERKEYLESLKQNQ